MPDLPQGAERLPGERVLAAASTADGARLAATTHRLVLRGGDGDVASYPWTQTRGAVLHADRKVLVVERTDGPTITLQLDESRASRRLGDTVRERIQHSILLTRVVDLPGRRKVTVAARREPGGTSFLQVVPDDERPLPPAAAAAVDQAVAAVREQAGLPPA